VKLDADRVRLRRRPAARPVLGGGARLAGGARRGGRASRLSAEGADDPEDDPSVMVEPPEDSGLPVLFFTEVAEEKAVKNRLHIDLVARREIPDEIDRLESLGASLRNWAESDGTTWAVMLDPEGNEFCVMPPED
jgi:hypothetical protein